MTTLPTLFTKDFDKFFVGYDQMFNQMAELSKTMTNYPPYNITKTDDNTYVIEMALAGFGKSDIEITTEGDKLTIKGNTQNEETETEKLYNGLALRPFTRLFTLNDQITVENAEMVNGLLKITLERLVPESKTKKIKVK